MRSKTLLWLSAIFMFIALLSSMTSATARRLNQEQSLKVAETAYLYGYPLVTMEFTRRIMTNTETPTETAAPMGQFTEVTYSRDTHTFNSEAWVDLTKEPYILQIPDAGNREFSLPILSAWGEVIASPGYRTTGKKAQTYALVGPNWRGSLPPGVTEMESPTNLVQIIGRTHYNGAKEDAEQNPFKLTPASFYGKDYIAPKGIKDPNIDMKTPIRDQVNALSAENYFKLLLTLLKKNPPASDDEKFVAKMAKMGLSPGQNFSLRSLDAATANNVVLGVKSAQAKIAAQGKNASQLSS